MEIVHTCLVDLSEAAAADPSGAATHLYTCTEVCAPSSAGALGIDSTDIAADAARAASNRVQPWTSMRVEPVKLSCSPFVEAAPILDGDVLVPSWELRVRVQARGLDLQVGIAGGTQDGDLVHRAAAWLLSMARVVVHCVGPERREHLASMAWVLMEQLELALPAEVDATSLWDGEAIAVGLRMLAREGMPAPQLQRLVAGALSTFPTTTAHADQLAATIVSRARLDLLEAGEGPGLRRADEDAFCDLAAAGQHPHGVAHQSPVAALTAAAAASRHLRALAEQMSSARLERDVQVARAFEAGHDVAALARATGMSQELVSAVVHVQEPRRVRERLGERLRRRVVGPRGLLGGLLRRRTPTEFLATVSLPAMQVSVVADDVEQARRQAWAQIGATLAQRGIDRRSVLVRLSRHHERPFRFGPELEPGEQEHPAAPGR